MGSTRAAAEAGTGTGTDTDTGTVRQIAAELYGLAPDDFTAARNARAKAEAKRSKPLAERIRRLPKPSAPAWAVNALVRTEPRMITDLLQLRDRFTEAQETGDRGELRQLDARRHESIAAALERAESLLSETGKNLGAQPAQDVEQTLRAAIADPNAAAAVQSGLLVRPLTASGFEPVDVTDAVAVPLESVVVPGGAEDEAAGGRRREAAKPSTKKAANGSNGGSKAARERARRAAAAAATAVADAEEHARESGAAVQAAENRLRQLSASAGTLGAEEDRLRKRLAQVREELAGLERDRTAAEHDRDRAQRTAERASRALERARERQESTNVVE